MYSHLNQFPDCTNAIDVFHINLNKVLAFWNIMAAYTVPAAGRYLVQTFLIKHTVHARRSVCRVPASCAGEGTCLFVIL